MGTRADFYVGRGESAEWLGSIAWDGYPAGIDEAVFTIADETSYRTAVLSFINREDGTLPEMGWPWPWDDSRTTDYAYAFDGGMVYGSAFGHEWFRVDPTADCYGEPDDENWTAEKVTFPDMSERKAVTFGKRSGVIIIGGGA